MPSAERVGVDIPNQRSLTREEAIELALKNNNDIDASRNNVQIAEFNLRGARGLYDPLIEGESYYDSTSTPTASITTSSGEPIRPGTKCWCSSSVAA